MTLEQMLQARVKPKLWKGEPVRYRQRKLDGHRVSLIRTGVELLAVGRNDTMLHEKYPAMQDQRWFKEAFKNMPPATMVDGELYYIGGTASDVTTRIVNNIESLVFTPFAVPFYNNRDLSTLDLPAGTGVLKQMKFGHSPYHRILAEDTRESMIQDAISLGIEGWVLKNYNNAEWYKLKPQKDIDVIVTGFQDGRGKYLGGVGALIVSVYIDDTLTEIAKVSGMTDDIRWDIDEEKDLGRVCEIRYECLASKGRLKHPRFVRWRDDKPSDECRVRREDL